jgi:hypothetical protein
MNTIMENNNNEENENGEDLIFFQPRPNFDLADALYDLGQRAKKEFGEPVFGEWMITQAMMYRTGRFQAQYQNMMEVLLQQEKEMEDEMLDDILKNTPIDKDKIM